MRDLSQVAIYILVALGFAANAWWQKRQERRAQDELQRHPPQTPPRQPLVTAPNQRYQEVQEEIRRRIAERLQAAPAGRPATTTTTLPAPPPVVVRTPPRPVALPTAAPARPPVRQPMRPAVAVEQQTAFPAARLAAAAPLAPVMAESFGMAAAYALATPETAGNSVAALQLVLANATAARQAFLFREIFDRPVCMRPAGCGGHEGWQ